MHRWSFLTSGFRDPILRPLCVLCTILSQIRVQGLEGCQNVSIIWTRIWDLLDTPARSVHDFEPILTRGAKMGQKSGPKMTHFRPDTFRTLTQSDQE